MFETKVVEKIKTHILCSTTSFLSENRVIFEIMWKSILEPDQPQMTIWRMPIACWIPKATDTRSEYVLLLLFHYNNGCTNASHCYVIHTLPV